MPEHGIWKRAPFFLPPPAPSFVSRCKEPCAQVCIHPRSHVQALSTSSAKAAPWPSFGPRAAHTNSSVYTWGTELWGRGPWKIWGHVGMLFQSLRDLKLVLERRHSSVWLHLLGSVDSLCCGKGYGWGRAIVGLRVHESPGWHQRWLVGGWEFYLRWSKIGRPLEFSKSKFKYMTFI